MFSNELLHYGVKGMRWGVRRAKEDLRRAHEEKGYGSKSEHNRAVAALSTHRDKATKKIQKLDQQYTTLTRLSKSKVTPLSKLAQNEMAKNRELKRMFNDGIKSINKDLVDKGMDYLYMRPDGLPYGADMFEQYDEIRD